MRRKKKNANKSINLQVLPLVHPNAAGIDVGAKEHVVAVPCDRDPKPLRTFQAFTPDLHELAAWLKRCGIETVALESTGIYWISLYEVLEQYGFEIRVALSACSPAASQNRSYPSPSSFSSQVDYALSRVLIAQRVFFKRNPLRFIRIKLHFAPGNFRFPQFALDAFL